mgnify:CR=1 FL=1
MIDLAKIRTAILEAEEAEESESDEVDVQEGPNKVPSEIDNAATSISGSFGVGLLGASIYSEATGGEWFVGQWRVIIPVVGTALTAFAYGRLSRGKEAKSKQKLMRRFYTK